MLRKLSILMLLIFVAVFAAACSSSTNNGTENHMNGMNNDEHTNNDPDHEHEDGDVEETIPNDGAVIHIVSPSDGAVFSAGEDISVEVEVENFTLGQDGNHWHIYVGDSEYAMVMGENTGDVVRGLEPGEYVISVSMANGDHQNLEDGDSITITVNE